MEDHVKTLAAKAAKATKADDAIKYSQSALHVANALLTVGLAKNKEPEADGLPHASGLVKDDTRDRRE